MDTMLKSFFVGHRIGGRNPENKSKIEELNHRGSNHRVIFLTEVLKVVPIEVVIEI